MWFNKNKKRVKELETALIEIYEHSSYDQHINLSKRFTKTNNDCFEKIYDRIKIPNLKRK